MNNKKCQNCGTENKNESKFCTQCGKPFEEQVTDQQNNIVQTNDNDTKTANTLATISLVLFFGGSIIIGFFSYMLPTNIRYSFSSLSGICPLAGIVTMIVGRVKYPTNKFLKIVMWIIIASIIISLIIFILFIIWCYVTCSTADYSGCG